MNVVELVQSEQQRNANPSAANRLPVIDLVEGVFTAVSIPRPQSEVNRSPFVIADYPELIALGIFTVVAMTLAALRFTKRLD